MRIIKFRAWDKKEKEIVFFGIDEAVENACWGTIWDINNRPENFLSTLMQFTGLTDKNGKEIYEKSDILQSEKSKDGFQMRDTIEFGWSSNGEYGLIWSTSKNIVLNVDCINERYEVIGNIYENPELIK